MATALDPRSELSAQDEPAPRSSDGIELTSRDRVLAAVVGAAAFIAYLHTLCPTIYTVDCGEIDTAVATGGVMHPPGYPLYCLLGGVLVHIIPFGEPAWRLGLLSSLAAACAVALVYLTGRRLGAGLVWSLAGSLCGAAA